MQRSGGRNTAAIFLLFLTLVVGRLGAAPITYVLLPGSTITPTVGPSPTGPTEDLTGSFTVQLASDYNFQYTALNFHSALNQVDLGSARCLEFDARRKQFDCLLPSRAGRHGVGAEPAPSRFLERLATLSRPAEQPHPL